MCYENLYIYCFTVFVCAYLLYYFKKYSKIDDRQIFQYLFDFLKEYYPKITNIG